MQTEQDIFLFFLFSSAVGALVAAAAADLVVGCGRRGHFSWMHKMLIFFFASFVFVLFRSFFVECVYIWLSFFIHSSLTECCLFSSSSLTFSHFSFSQWQRLSIFMHTHSQTMHFSNIDDSILGSPFLSSDRTLTLNNEKFYFKLNRTSTRSLLTILF